MPDQIKTRITSKAYREGIFIILLLTLAIYCLVLPSAHKDLAFLSNNSSGLLQSLIFSSSQLKSTIEAYGNEGRNLYQFILLTVGLAAAISLFILSVLAGHWLTLKKRYWKNISVWWFPTIYFFLTSLELIFFYVLLEIPFTANFFFYNLTIFISILKWLSIILLIASISIPFFNSLWFTYKKKRSK